jgi:serine/threonine-protein phosphatase 2A regulatory subunit B
MQHDLCLASRAKRIYANAHTYHINSISVNSDQQTFLSADDLRINLWSLDITDQSFNIVDIKPPNMDDLTEVWQLCRAEPAAARCCIRLAAGVQQSLPSQHSSVLQARHGDTSWASAGWPAQGTGLHCTAHYR